LRHWTQIPKDVFKILEVTVSPSSANILDVTLSLSSARAIVVPLITFGEHEIPDAL